MYDVNTEKIEKVLSKLDEMLALLGELGAREDEEVLGDRVAVAAMERGLHLAIEAIADVGNALIDGFIMRDPGSYTDIVEILRDEQVIDDHQASVLSDVVSFRKHLVSEYTQVPHQKMIMLVRSSLEVLHTFAPAVRTFISRELF